MSTPACESAHPPPNLRDPSLLVLKTSVERFIECGPCTATCVPAAGEPRGAPVVLLHGAWHSAWYFRGLQETLAARGHDSYALALNNSRFKTLESHGEDVAAALAALDLEGPILAGHSQGGLIAQHYVHLLDGSLQARNRVRAVAFLGTAPLGHAGLVATLMQNAFGRTYRATGAGGLLRLQAGAMWDGRLWGEDNFRALFCRPGASASDTTDVTGVEMTLAEYYAMCSGLPGDMACVCYGHPFLTRWRSEPVPVLAVPSLAVHFEHDCNFTAEHYAEFAARGSEVLFVNGQGHCASDPGWKDSFAAPFADWLGRVSH